MVDKILKYFASCFPIPNKAAVILAVDVASDKYVIAALEKALKAIDCKVEILDCGSVAQPYEGISMKLFDVISRYSYLIDLTTASCYHTELSRQYVDMGGSILVMFGVKKAGFRQMFIEADIDEMIRRGAELQRKFIGKKEVVIKSPSGTNVSVPVKKLSLVMKDVGRYLKAKGKQVTLYGYVAMPVEFSGMNGTIVVNDFVWPPNELGLLGDPIILSIKDGFIIDMQTKGKSVEFIEWMKQFSDPNVKKLSHIVLGLIPTVVLSESLVTNERIPGALTFGFGDPWNGCQTHTDMVVCDAEVFVDGKKLST